MDSAERTVAAPGGAAHDFDAIVGVQPTGSQPRPDPAAPQSIAPETASRASRHPGTRARALIVFGVLSAAGVALAASIIVSVEVSQTPLTRGAQVLSGEKLAASARSAPADSRVPFGGTTALGSDLAVTVTDPIAYTPSPEAVGAGAGVDVVSTVTVTNLGSGPAEPRLGFAVQDTTGTRIFDGPGGIRLGSSRSLLPGDSATYRVAFAVQDVPKMAMRVSAGDDSVLVGR